MIAHPARRAAAAAADALDPATEWEEIYRRLILTEHFGEARLGFQLAFYRPLAVPRMAALLARTGHFRNSPLKRAYDTGIVMYEIIHGGFDSPRAQKMVRLMNALHARHEIEPEDMTYVLCAFIVAATRTIDRAGWRAVTPAQKTATVAWYARLAELMGIAQVPRDYAQAEAWFDAYELSHVRPSPQSAELAQALIDVISGDMPAVVAPWTRQVTSALIGESRLSEALGFGPVNPAAARLASLLIGLRRVIVRFTPPRSDPRFIPGHAAKVAYPNGYSLDDIGPQAADV